MEKYFYTVGEVAEIIGESTSLVRFWANEFPKFIKPQRNAKGNRLFTKEDVEIFKQLHLLVKVEGLTLEGAAKRLKGEKKERLKQINTELTKRVFDLFSASKAKNFIFFSTSLINIILS